MTMLRRLRTSRINSYSRGKNMSYAERLINSPIAEHADAAADEPVAPTRIEVSCFVTYDPDTIDQARRMTAREYLRRKFITSDEINAEGVISEDSDPHHSHSRYFVDTVGDGSTVSATLRTLHYDGDMGHDSFPVLTHEDELYPEYMEKINKLGYENIIEVSALVRDRELDSDGTAALKLYREVFLDAIANDENGKTALVMACNPKLAKKFRLLFDGSMKRIGPNLDYPGQEAVPMMTMIRDGMLNLINVSKDRQNPYRNVHKLVVEYFFTESNHSRVHPDIIQALEENGYNDIVEKMASGDWGNTSKLDKTIVSKIERAAVLGKIREGARKYRPEALATAGLIGYTLARTAAVAEGIAPESDASWEAFLAIELATTPQYVWGVGDLARNAGKEKEEYSTKRKLGAIAAAGSAFVAPYGYLAARGGFESEQGLAVGAGMLVIAGVSPVAKAIKKRVVSRKNKEQE